MAFGSIIQHQTAMAVEDRRPTSVSHLLILAGPGMAAMAIEDPSSAALRAEPDHQKTASTADLGSRSETHRAMTAATSRPPGSMISNDPPFDRHPFQSAQIQRFQRSSITHRPRTARRQSPTHQRSPDVGQQSSR
ncbi:hypothetical protein ACLOJK_006911 [Asimina triloba]